MAAGCHSESARFPAIHGIFHSNFLLRRQTTSEVVYYDRLYSHLNDVRRMLYHYSFHCRNSVCGLEGSWLGDLRPAERRAERNHSTSYALCLPRRAPWHATGPAVQSLHLPLAGLGSAFPTSRGSPNLTGIAPWLSPWAPHMTTAVQRDKQCLLKADITLNLESSESRSIALLFPEGLDYLFIQLLLDAGRWSGFTQQDRAAPSSLCTFQSRLIGLAQDCRRPLDP